MPPQDANPTPSFGGFGLRGLYNYLRSETPPKRGMLFPTLTYAYATEKTNDRGGLVCLNSAARFDKWNRAAVR